MYHHYSVIIAPTIAQDVVDLFRQRSDGAWFSVCEGLLVNDMSLAPILLIFDVHCSRIGLLEKG